MWHERGLTWYCWFQQQRNGVTNQIMPWLLETGNCPQCITIRRIQISVMQLWGTEFCQQIEESEKEIFPSCCCTVTKSCPTFCDPMEPGRLLWTSSQSLLKVTSIELVMLSNNLSLCCPMLLSSSISPSIKVFSNELALLIREPKYWSFSFCISPSKDYSGFITLRID